MQNNKPHSGPTPDELKEIEKDDFKTSDWCAPSEERLESFGEDDIILNEEGVITDGMGRTLFRTH